MEKVMCTEHGALCMLKTGVRDGATKGKSFYLCATQQTSHCSFVQLADIPVSHCLVHEDSIVELQAIHKKSDTRSYRLYYRCIKGKEDKLKWCGNVPWQVSYPNISSTNRDDHQDTQQSLVSENQQRNPFKIPAKNQKQPTSCITTNSSSKQGAEPESDRKHNKAVDESVGLGGSPPTYNEKATKKSSNGLKISERLCDEGEKTHVKDFEKTQKETRPHLKCDARMGGIDSGRNHNLPSDPLPDERGKVSKVSHIVEKDKVPLESEVKCVHKESLNNLSHHGNSAHVKMGIAKDGQASSSKSTNEKSLGTQKCNGTSVSQQNESTYTPENDVQWKQTTKVERDASSVLTAHKSDSNKPANEESESCRQIDVKASVSISAGNIYTTFEQSVSNSHSVNVKQSITTKNPKTSHKQATLTAFPGFEYASGKMETKKTAALHNQLTVQLQQRKHTLKTVNITALPDKGQRLINQVKELEDALSTLHLTASDKQDKGEEMKNRLTNPFDKSVTTLSKPAIDDLKSAAVLPRFNEASSLGSSQFSNQVYAADFQQQSACGGQKGQDRLYTIKKVTSEAIEQLHKSLETCPDTIDETEDPQYLKVTLLVHQRQALAWLLWREKQRPSGGILADDMGLGKTLTMIALILTQRCKGKKEKEKDTDEWISKAESTLATSNGTLVICPASLIHHWKMEIERHVCAKKLSIYMYHGSNREKSTKVLSEFDVVITTYGLVAKEIPAKNEKGKCTATDEALAEVKSSHSPLLKLAWARIILDEAHNIKNPQIQTSMAVCKLRAGARWAITGTPIQNNLLDMYSLLKFLHCSPFDDFKLWKNQVDNGTRKGGERLNIITRSLLLRRNKGQLDSSGKPLVELPQRFNRSHRLKLSEDEEAVYSVLYARSRSTLQSYLKRHEGKGHKANSSHGADNPFNRVGREFGIDSVSDGPSSSQRASPNSSTVHILSSLLRLRQCCCHLSLLKTALTQTEMEPEGISLSLEEQLNALSLTEVTATDNKTTVTLNGTSFEADLFESTRQSTKITALLEELKVIRSSPEPQKSVIISQWTSMLHVVAAHLDRIKLSHVTLDGTVTPKRRMDMVEEFNTNPKGPQVMLVSLCAGGVGLNLIGGNNLFLLDMHWNPALEEQASDRIYRVGQRKDVTVHRFVCKGTIEDKIFELQEKKKELAKKVLSGTGEMFTKLTLADLRILFGV
ncbi:transcription termination factor 2 isoform X1 [Amblyraja radiata]|uniref:transcription termination factor 2 isoform X1 n=2 Tax=Amblyraja radiata TaxID=386614 RepID=UPI0014040E97|nr:transcription termination factor 2 isoform X1 [Amblyraja radiata]